MDNKKKNRSLSEKILWISIVLIGCVLIFLSIFTTHEGSKVVVRVSGQNIASFPIEVDRIYTIEGKSGHTNKLIIKNGSVWIETASCPDELCVKQGKIRNAGQSIVCLPNRVVVEIEKNEHDDSEHNAENEVDAVVQ